MAASYSLDLRNSVFGALQQGVPILRISKIFSISRRTIYYWKDQLNHSGHLLPQKPGPKKGSNRKIKDIESFTEYVQQKPDRTLQEIAEDFGNISQECVRKTLKAANFSYKKNIWVQTKK